MNSRTSLAAVLCGALTLLGLPSNAWAQTAPTITSVVPRYASTEGGTKLDILGKGFSRSMTLTFAGVADTVGRAVPFELVDSSV